jgi:colanic acid biosynthesis glycosyl transferase WcaI
MSFVFTSTWRALFLPAPDVYVMVSPPLFLGFGLTCVSRLKRRPFLVHVQDLQPDAALGLGMIKPGLAVRLLYVLEKWNYTLAARVSGISQGMLQAFARKRVPAEKIVMYPNWIPDGRPAERGAGASFRAANGISKSTPLIAYSGNVGVKQGLEAVVHAAALAKERAETDGSGGTNDAATEIHWAICGEGAAKPDLEKVAKEKGLAAVKLYPLQPDELYHAMLREADISLITQQRGTGQFFFPSKLLSILQYGRPVLAVADDTSELSRAVAEGKFGLVVEPGDSAALLNAAQTMLRADQAQRDQWAANGRAWVDQFRRSRVLGEFEEVLRAVAFKTAGEAGSKGV